MQISSGLSEKKIYWVESLQFVGMVEISLYRKNHFGVILIGVGHTLFVDTFCGLELGPKS